MNTIKRKLRGKGEAYTVMIEARRDAGYTDGACKYGESDGG